MMIDKIRFGQLLKDIIKWEATKTNEKYLRQFQIYEKGISWKHWCTRNQANMERFQAINVIGSLYRVCFVSISGVVQHEDAPRTGTMELNSGKDYNCEC